MAMRSNTGNFEIRELKSLGKLISSAENLIKENKEISQDLLDTLFKKIGQIKAKRLALELHLDYTDFILTQRKYRLLQNQRN